MPSLDSHHVRVEGASLRVLEQPSKHEVRLRFGYHECRGSPRISSIARKSGTTTLGIRIFPHEASLLRLLTALAIEQNDSWRSRRWLLEPTFIEQEDPVRRSG